VLKEGRSVKEGGHGEFLAFPKGEKDHVGQHFGLCREKRGEGPLVLGKNT